MRAETLNEKNISVSADYTGRDPVYYMLTEDGIRISSDIRELIREKGTTAVINKEALKMFLVFQYVPTCETIVEGIYRLAPGSTLNYSKEQGFNTCPHPHPIFRPIYRPLLQSATNIQTAVDAAVHASKPSEGKIGCFLSSGVDSSYLATLLRPDITFTFAFEDSKYDEAPMAKDLSDKLGVENKCLRISSDDFFASISAVQKVLGQPYANLTGIPVYCLAEMAGRDVKTVFSGEGPDEMFGGYARYRVGFWERTFRILPAWCRKLAARIFANFPNGRVRQFLNDCATTVEENYIGQADIMSDQEANELLTQKYRSDIMHTDVTGPIFKNISGGSVLDKKQYLDLNLWAPFDNTLSLFAIGRHFGLDIIAPFQDDRLLKVALSLPEYQRVKRFKTKIAFRQAASAYLSKENYERPKMGMPMPYGSWFKNEKYLDLIQSVFSSAYATEFFDTDKLMDLLKEHREGNNNNAKKLYTVYCFLLWYRDVFLPDTGKESFHGMR